MSYVPVNLLESKIKISYEESNVLLETDFDLQMLFDWSNTVVVTLKPCYKSKVYGLCGNVNGYPEDEHLITADNASSPATKSSLGFVEAYQLFDGDQNGCKGCWKVEGNLTLTVPSYRSMCGVLMDPKAQVVRAVIL